MKKRSTWAQFGRIAFWVAWPLLFWYLRSGKRTRLLVTAGNKVLVVQSWISDGRWKLPGGGLRLRESPVQGVLRELREETGLELKRKQVKLLYKTGYAENGLRYRYYCYKTELPKVLPASAQSLEILDVQWVDKGQLNEQNAAQDVLTALSAWSKRKA